MVENIQNWATLVTFAYDSSRILTKTRENCGIRANSPIKLLNLLESAHQKSLKKPLGLIKLFSFKCTQSELNETQKSSNDSLKGL